jgi:hypothetical protein
MSNIKEAYWKVIDQMVNDNTKLEPVEGCECGCCEQDNEE